MPLAVKTSCPHESDRPHRSSGTSCPWKDLAVRAQPEPVQLATEPQDRHTGCGRTGSPAHLPVPRAPLRPEQPAHLLDEPLAQPRQPAGLVGDPVASPASEVVGGGGEVQPAAPSVAPGAEEEPPPRPPVRHHTHQRHPARVRRPPDSVPDHRQGTATVTLTRAGVPHLALRRPTAARPSDRPSPHARPAEQAPAREAVCAQNPRFLGQRPRVQACPA
jgi:hypothetical protein